MTLMKNTCLTYNLTLLLIALNVILGTMVTIVIYHVKDVYQIHVIVNMVSVQILLDVNLDGNLGNQSVI